MITSITFDNFKSLKRYSVSLKRMNVLVGPNNSGKSSILDALRILAGAYRYASRLNPTWITFSERNGAYGYEIPESSIPIALENVHTDYNDEPSRIKYRFNDDKYLCITFLKERQPLLHYETNGRNLTTASSFKREFPLSLAIIPTLGPLEHEEEIKKQEYVSRWKGSHRAPLLFRNIWYHDKSDFEEFQKLVEETWPGMSATYPEKPGMFSNKLVMFCKEQRIPREIFWAGNGFQIWLQLLTHIVKNREAEMLVVDEPEIYLHPDLQRKIVDILKRMSGSVVLATHSVEIINEIETEDVLIVDKTQRSAKRLVDLDGLQQAVTLLGSTQNINLARLARGKHILFVEGQDRKILLRLAQTAGFPELFTKGDLTLIPIDGFTQWERANDTKWAFDRILKEKIKISSIYDKDYRCQEEIDAFLMKIREHVPHTYILERKEIENYLLVPRVLKRVIYAQLAQRKAFGAIRNIPEIKIEEILRRNVDKQKNHVFGQLVAHEYKFKRSAGVDVSTIAGNRLAQFETNWKDIERCLSMVSGKELIASLNTELQSDYGISFSAVAIIAEMSADDISSELKEVFGKIDQFRMEKSGVIPSEVGSID